MFYTVSYPSPVGLLRLVSDAEHLVALWMEGQDKLPKKMPDITSTHLPPVLFETERWLDQYFAREAPDPCRIPMKPLGEETGVFRRAVWQCLREIPYGEVTTYGAIARDVAARLGKERMSAQAVGGAVGHNPIGILIPCHRVVGRDGALTGYAGGLERKAFLLSLEGVVLPSVKAK